MIYCAEVVRLQKNIEIDKEIATMCKAQGDHAGFIEAVRGRKNVEAKLERFKTGQFLFNNSAFSKLAGLIQ
jgi:hypothetical protein